ncbi:MAG TPA: dihydrolipoyllysine-residue succinyltransferase, partial [Rhodobiaceae bacterium]|nr:dihydrolipoyllysine-residue succinyltransferase [Rhodobiaceae bacterium]
KSNENLEKKYKPPEKEEKPISVYEEKIEKPKKINKKKSSNGSEVLKLEEEKVQPALILEDEHMEDNSEMQKIVKTASPSAKKIAQERNINLEEVQGSGKRGMIMKGDLIDLMGSKPAPNLKKIKDGPEERIKMTRLRLTIAKRLKEAQENAAMLTTFNEVDMSALMQLRSEYKDLFEKKYGVRLGFMSFFVRACVTALHEIPAVNAEISGDEIIYKNYVNMGIAVGTEKGLVVPVLRDVQDMGLALIEQTIGVFGQKARDGKLAIEDLQGGTFTVSNGGVYGSLMSTPILNLPQSGVLGMHKIQQRPMVVNGQVEVRPMMYLALSYDHRIVDGKEAVTFLVRVKESLEAPERLLLDI